MLDHGVWFGDDSPSPFLVSYGHCHWLAGQPWGSHVASVDLLSLIHGRKELDSASDFQPGDLEL